MRTIYLFRHGEAEWNAEGRFQGALDSPLTPRGIAQAEACGRRLAAVAGPVDALVASPLGRVRQTEAIARRFADLPATIWDPRLAEISLGSWDGLTDIDIDAQWPGALDGSTPFDWFFRAPGGEPYDAAVQRARAWLDDVHDTTVAISHGMIGRIIRGAWLGLSRDETLALPVPQDVIWRLAEGRVDAIDA